MQARQGDHVHQAHVCKLGTAARTLQAAEPVTVGLSIFSDKPFAFTSRTEAPANVSDHGATPGRAPSITARPSADEKARFAWLAERAGMSESALALMAIRSMMNPDGKAVPGTAATAPTRVRATDRITVRLRPGDRAAIAHRAARRGVKASTYLAALARAHVAANPPLAAPELAALKQSILVLAGLGRLLSQTARNPALTRREFEDLRQQLTCTQNAISALEQRTHDLARAALISWESCSD